MRRRPPPEEHKPLDAFGREVPDGLKNVFLGRWIMRDLCLKLEMMKGEVSAIRNEPYTTDMDAREVIGLLETLRIKVVQAMPHQRCDCHAWEETCPKCRGLQWVSMLSLMGRRPQSREP